MTTARQLQRRVAERIHPGAGCTDGGCVFGAPDGMHTNGGCECLNETNRVLLKRNLMRMADVCRALAAIIPEEGLAKKAL